MILSPTIADHEQQDRRLGRRDQAVLLVASACLQAIAWAVLLALFSAGRMGYGLHQLADTPLYMSYAGQFMGGRWPYTTVPVEYPPLANLVFLLAPSGGTVAAYDRVFSTWMILAVTAAAVVTTATAALSWRSVSRGLTSAVAYAVLTLACGSLALNKYDAVVALTVAATLLLLTLRRNVPAGVTVGLGFALKLTPALLLPLVLLIQQSRSRAAYVSTAFLIAATMPFLPFVVHDPGTAAQPFTYHTNRPLQLESILATPWMVAALTDAAHPVIVHAYGSQNFAGTAQDILARLSPWLLLLGTTATYLLIWRRRMALRASPALLPVAALAVLLVAVCTSKVLSPQFLIWIFPVLALCAAQTARLPRLAALSAGLAVLLTQVEFPARYWNLVDLNDGSVAILIARNVLLVTGTALSILAVWRLGSGVPSTQSLPSDPQPEVVTSRS